MDKCSCGRDAKYKACSHVEGGKVKEIDIHEDRATCGAKCSKLIPDDSFSPLCSRCLDKLTAPENPEKELEKILAEEEKEIALWEELKRKQEEREEKKRELKRHLAGDFVEELFGELQGFLAHFQPGGILHKNYELLQALNNKVQLCDSTWPKSLSTKEYSAVVNRQDPVVAYHADLVRNAGLDFDLPLPKFMQRIFKSENTDSPYWKEKEP